MKPPGPPVGPRAATLPLALLLAIISGVLLWLANPPVGLWPLAFGALIPLLWVIGRSRPRRGALLGLVFGLTYFGLLLSWIMLFGKPAWAGLVLANAAYAAAFGAMAPALWRREAIVRTAIGVAALWTALEFALGSWPLGGFTWGNIAYSQASNAATIRLASITGALGISFLVVVVNVLLLGAGIRWGRNRTMAGLLAASGVVLALLPALIPVPAANGRQIDVATIQIDLPTTPDEATRNIAIANQFESMHRSLASDRPDLVIWPENVFDVDPSLDPSFGRPLVETIRTVGTPTLVGAITGPASGTQFNSTIMYGADGLVRDVYDKVHLVPFGEYAPFRDSLGQIVKEMAMIRRDLTPGSQIDPIRMPGMIFGSSICYENAFAGIDRQLVAEGSQFLVVSTNNANYGYTAASEQHLAISRLRAVENARWVVHAGLTGISAFVDPTGKVYDETGLFQNQIMRGTIQASTATTIYTRYGDWFAWASVFMAVGAFIIPRRKRERGSAPPLGPDARTLVILPTYNEAATIAEVLSRLLELPGRIEILVVDDSSPDGTGDIVRKHASAGAPIQILERPSKSGLASAYLEGFKVAMDAGFELAVEMDSDLSHQPEELSGLLSGAQGADLTIGSRYVPGGSVTNWGAFRRLLSQAGNAYARLCLGFPIRDATSGFRVYRRHLLEALLTEGVTSEGYGFQIELAYRSWREGFAVTEVPITFREREHGTSKISRRIVFEALWQVTKWGTRARFRPDLAPTELEEEGS